MLSLTNIHKTFQNGEEVVTALNDVSIEIKENEFVAIMGSSGSGKSTLMNVLGCLDTPTSGVYKLNGQDVASMTDDELSQVRNKHIGFIYQFHHLMMEFSAEENVAMPLLIRGDNPKQALRVAQEMLEKVGLSHRGHHRPSELSGGERQRVAIARSLVTNPSLVLADEPTGNLDFDTAEQIFQLLKSLNATVNTSFVIVTHDLVLASRMDRQLKLEHGILSPLESFVKNPPQETVNV